MLGMSDIGYEALTIIVSNAGLLWLFIRQTNRQIDALRSDFNTLRSDFNTLRSDTAKQFEAQRADTAALRSDFTKQLDAQHADFDKRFDAQHADTARQFESLRAEHRDGLAQVGERLAELRADFRAVLPRAAAEPARSPLAARGELEG